MFTVRPCASVAVCVLVRDLPSAAISIFVVSVGFPAFFAVMV
jgi:hypothetical protein